MKAVMLSIQPKWCELITSGKKTLEVRKTRPKLETPFKVYIYCTKGNLSYSVGNGMICNLSGGMVVIGEFVCDSIRRFDVPYPAYQSRLDPQILEDSCCTYYALHRYAYHDALFGWHISELKIYDKPKPLSGFLPMCQHMMDDGSCEHRKIACPHQRFDYNPWPDCSLNLVSCGKRMTRPPQSWCYVEEL